MKKNILFIIMIIAAGSLSCYDGLLETRNTIYKLRDIGPAGGLIFYINPDYEKDGWRYLEAAPVSTELTAFWSNDILTYHNTKTGIGTGQANTSIVVLWLNTFGELGQGRAVQICDTLTYGGYSDWFLPSKDELDLMCWNLRGKKYLAPDNPDVPAGGVGNFSIANYWSSSDSNANSGWMCDFTTGQLIQQTKITQFSVRAIRAF